MVEKIKVDSTGKVHLFKEFLTPDNKKILFSGKFGSGKTTFLTDFFDQNREFYLPIKLSPVNYSIANNEDIFELIKHDILIQLIDYQIENKIILFDEIELSKFYIFQWYLAGEIQQPIKQVLEINDKIGLPRRNVISYLNTKLQECKKYIEQLKKGEMDIVLEYLKKFENKTGSIYECDQITYLIRGALQKLKILNAEKNQGFSVVLVIDDLDRLDPEHIFRILNIFSVHMDHRNEQEDKFGFDNIILSCDEENIENIFYHKYGPKTDFKGYIGKFKSKKTFDFDLSQMVAEKVWSFLATFPGDHKKYSVYNENTHDFLLLKDLTEFYIKNGFLNIRDLVKFERRVSEMHINFIKPTRNDIITENPFIPILNVLIYMFGSTKQYFNVMENMIEADGGHFMYHEHMNTYILYILPLCIANRKAQIGPAAIYVGERKAVDNQLKYQINSCDWRYPHKSISITEKNVHNLHAYIKEGMVTLKRLNLLYG